eukprot:TRINITY_DN48301_c0_g1_i2.p4 TRINITY_DN48301_c0_g1~~TRINITY_DN48301_c0_g1_i2.p4  ORF type:complete len:133 (+),score=16.87 TRINITY_DN48301_c0_g1_i2:268-666(+)
MEVIGTTYPIPPYKQALSSATSVVQMGAIGVAIFGEQLRQFAGLTDEMMPPWYFPLQQTKIGVALGVWFFGNAISNSLVSTGAFEIYYNGQLIFSKLNEGRLPNLADVYDGIEHVRHGGTGQIVMEQKNKNQ